MSKKLNDKFFGYNTLAPLTKVVLPLEIYKPFGGDIGSIINILIQNSAYRIYVCDTEDVERLIEEKTEYDKIIIPIKKDPKSNSTYEKILDFFKPILYFADRFEKLDILDTIALLYNLHFASEHNAELIVHWDLYNFMYRLNLLPQSYERDQIIGLLNIYNPESGLPVLKPENKPGFEHRLFDILLREEYYKLSKLNHDLGTIGQFGKVRLRLKQLKNELQIATSDLYNVSKLEGIKGITQTTVNLLSDGFFKIVPNVEEILRITKIIPKDYTPPIRSADAYLVSANFEYRPRMFPIGPLIPYVVRRNKMV